MGETRTNKSVNDLDVPAARDLLEVFLRLERLVHLVVRHAEDAQTRLLGRVVLREHDELGHEGDGDRLAVQLRGHLRRLVDVLTVHQPEPATTRSVHQPEPATTGSVHQPEPATTATTQSVHQPEPATTATTLSVHQPQPETTQFTSQKLAGSDKIEQETQCFSSTGWVWLV